MERPELLSLLATWLVNTRSERGEMYRAVRDAQAMLAIAERAEFDRLADQAREEECPI